MDIQLLINNTPVELGSNFTFPITKTFSSLETPTDIIVDYSKAVNIPVTPQNEKLFTALYLLNRLYLSGGIYFNPLKRHNCKLLFNGDVIIDGYAKIVSATKNYYTINVVGALGEVFKTLGNYIFTDDVTNEYKIPDYLPSVYYSLNNVRDSITTYQQRLILDDNCTFTDCFGFFLGFNGAENVENGNYLEKTTDGTAEMPYKISKYSDTLSAKYPTITGFDTLLKNGLYWWDIMQTKIYNFTPYVYCNKLFQVYAKLMQEKTDYKLSLDTSFFHPNNPHYTNSIYTLNKLDKSKDTTVTTEEVEASFATTADIIWQTSTGIRDYYPENITFTPSQLITNIVNNNYTLCDDGVSFNFDAISDINDAKIEFEGGFDLTYTSSEYNSGTYNVKMKEGYIVFNVDAVDTATNEVLQTVRSNYYCGADNYSYYVYTNNYSCGNKILGTITNGVGTLNFTGAKMAFKPSLLSGHRVKFQLSKIEIQSQAHATHHSLFYLERNGNTYWAVNNQITHCKGTFATNINGKGVFTKNIGYDTLFGSNFNLQDWVINYTKKYGLIWVVDYINKEVKILTKDTYYKDNKVVDLSNNLVGTLTIKPTVVDAKYYKYTYKDSTTQHDKYIEDNYFVKYGEKRLKTNNEFSENETVLYDKDNTSICGVQPVRSWQKMYNDGIFKLIPSVYSLPTFHTEEDGAYKSGDEANRFFYRNPTNINIGGTLYICSSTPWEEGQNKYYYYSTSAYSLPTFQNYITTVTSLPNITTYYGGKSILFGVPVYDFGNNYGQMVTSATIYDDYWESWINGLYDVNNKIVEAKFNLPFINFCNLKLNDFVKINDSLFIINKISDYEITTGEGKIELIQLNNLDWLDEIQTKYNGGWLQNATLKFNNVVGCTLYTYAICTNEATYTIRKALSGGFFDLYVDDVPVANGETITITPNKVHIIKVVLNTVATNIYDFVSQFYLLKDGTQIASATVLVDNITPQASGFDLMDKELNLKPTNQLSTTLYTTQSTLITNKLSDVCYMYVNSQRVYNALNVNSGTYTITVNNATTNKIGQSGYIEVKTTSLTQNEKIIVNIIS